MYEEQDFLIRCSDAPEISCTVVVICILATVLDEKVEGRVNYHLVNGCGLKERGWLAMYPPTPPPPSALLLDYAVDYVFMHCML